MPTIPKRVADRLTVGLRKYQKIFASAHDRDVNESDTVVIIADFLSEVLGFDKYTEITTEFAIRGTYCDLAIKIGGTVQYLVEAKAIGVSLKEAHLRQAISYASNHGVEWVILTNGINWQVHRLRFEQPISTDLVFALNIREAGPRDGDVLERLFLLTKEGIGKSAIEEFHERKDACSPFLVGAVLQSDQVLGVLRRELKRVSPKARIEVDELRSVLKEEVLKRDVVEGDEAGSAKSRLKRAASRTLRKGSRASKLEDSGEPKAVEGDGGEGGGPQKATSDFA
jgi:hypothetical protein